MSAMSTLDAMTSASRARADELKAELEEAHRTIASLTLSVSELRHTLARTEEKLDRLFTERAGLRSALVAQYEHIFSLQSTIADLDAKLDAAYTVIRQRTPADAPIIFTLTDKAEQFLAGGE